MDEIGLDSPILDLIGVGQGISGGFALKAHVIELGLSYTKACLNVPEALPKGELRKGHAKKLVGGSKNLVLVAPFVTSPAFAKFVLRQEVHQARKNRSAGIDALAPLQRIEAYGDYGPRPQVHTFKSIDRVVA